jgi:2-polyprenyl-6-methoxyphenol hydroxylase-like FAD-dependent oxidoreductase
VGAGPAGASLAHVLAQRGIQVTLLERQRDFDREFRGEVLMPGGIEALQGMGLGPALEASPRSVPSGLELFTNGAPVFRFTLDAEAFRGQPPVATSQPALLEEIVKLAGTSDCFHLLRGATARDLLWESDRVAGVRVHSDDGTTELRADLVIGADGRGSLVRRRAGLTATEQAPPMDVVWFKVAPLPGMEGARAYIGGGHLLIAYPAWDGQLQVAWAIVKGTFGELRSRGIEQWVEELCAHVSSDLAEHLARHSGEIQRPFLLDVVSDRVTSWWAPGALVIGDAAHTMSPVGAQGLNLALRDAVVVANQLVPVLQADPQPDLIDEALERVQDERLPEIRAIQRLQALPPRFVLSRAFWGEPVRRLLLQLLRTRFVQSRALADAELFQFGMGKVELRV